MRVKIILLIVSVIAVFTLSTCSDLTPPTDPTAPSNPAPPSDPNPPANPPATYGTLRIVDEDVFTDGSLSYIGATIDGVDQGTVAGSAYSVYYYGTEIVIPAYFTDFNLSTGDHQVHLWKMIAHPGGYSGPFTSDGIVTIQKDVISIWTL